MINKLFQSTLVRYAIAGGTASGIEILLLYTVTEYAGVYYLFSALLAVTVSFFVRFFLQKLFAFRDRSFHMLPKQIGLFALLYAWSASSTVGLLYVFTEIVGWWYMLSQVVTILLIAGISFFVYRYIIFPTTHAGLT